MDYWDTEEEVEEFYNKWDTVFINYNYPFVLNYCNRWDFKHHKWRGVSHRRRSHFVLQHCIWDTVQHFSVWSNIFATLVLISTAICTVFRLYPYHGVTMETPFWNKLATASFITKSFHGSLRIATLFARFQCPKYPLEYVAYLGTLSFILRI